MDKEVSNTPELHVVCRLAATPHSLHAPIDSLIRTVKLLKSSVEIVAVVVDCCGNTILSSRNQFARVGNLSGNDVENRKIRHVWHNVPYRHVRVYTW